MAHIPREFSREVEGDAQKIRTEYDKNKSQIWEKRTDFRDWYTFTIDGSDARDLDDALSIRSLENGHILLGVHIADVAEYVTEGSALDREALTRATSIYTP